MKGKATDRSEYKVKLGGVEAFDLSVTVLRDLCDILVEGAQRAARFAVEGRSQARGGTPAWLVTAADLRIAKYAPGSLELSVSAPPLQGTAPPGVILPLAPFVHADTTALDLFLDAAEDAVAGRQDSERLDAGVLDVLARTGALFARGPVTLSVERRGAKPVLIEPGTAQSIQAMAARTPAAGVARIRGVLDAVTMSTRTFVLRIDGGKALRGLAADVAMDTLKSLLGLEIVVEGLVVYKPSGEALRIEVDHAAPARKGDALWARLPQVDVGARRIVTLAVAPELDQFLQAWPGEEPDEVIFRKLEELS